MSNTWKTTVNDIVQVDQSTFDFPRNTTWLNTTYQDQEPSKPLPVTYSPESNEDNLDQNSPGGYPRRFMGKPKGEWSSTDGEIIPALENMLKNKKASLEFPLAGSVVDGRTVGQGVPNQSSIGASLDDYTILKGIREVPFSAFTQMPALSYYSTDEEKRTKELAEQIKQTGEITPLIIAVDNQGPYILEGGHRFDALRELGANSFPAMVVLDNESLNREAAINSLTREITASNQDGGWINPSGKYVETKDHFGYVSAHPEVFGLPGIAEITTKFERDSAAVRAFGLILDKGWIRVRVWGDAIMVQSNTLSNAKAHAEEFIYNNLNATKRIRIETDNEQAYTCTTDEFKQDGWNAFLKQPVMAKQAATLPPQQYIPENLNAQTAIMTDDGSIYWSDEPRMIHVQFIRQLGIPVERIVSGGRIVDGDYHDLGPRSDTMRYVEQMLAKKRVEERYNLKRQAGSQSASVPDYLCDEWKTEQINNDTDEEPYVNHDQRDYPYGMHDSPENTDSGIGWNKDETRSVCLLDQLQNPSERNFPPGMMDYEVINYYNSAPMSDALEATNPD